MAQTIDEFYSPEVLRELQLMELDILKDFDALCKKHDLEYFGAFGTLLGAIRHKGIIPWDDDIDIAMPRRDYDKLRAIVEAELSDKYNFMNNEVNSHYPFITSRLMRKGTEFRTLSMKDCKCELGVFLDIFCFENMPNDPRERNWYLKKCWVLEKLSILRNMPFPNLPYTGVKRVLAYVACAIGFVAVKIIPRATLHRLTKSVSSKYKDCKTNYIGNPFGLTPKNTTYELSDIYPLERVPFEDFEMPIPAKADKILRQKYGESYMTPPEKGKRSDIVPYHLDLGYGLIEGGSAK